MNEFSKALGEAEKELTPDALKHLMDRMWMTFNEAFIEARGMDIAKEMELAALAAVFKRGGAGK